MLTYLQRLIFLNLSCVGYNNRSFMQDTCYLRGVQHTWKLHPPPITGFTKIILLYSIVVAYQNHIYTN